MSSGQDIATWPQIVGVAALCGLGLLAWLRYRRGYGMTAEYRNAHPDYTKFLVSLGYALPLLNATMLSALVVLLATRALIDTGVDLFGFVVMIFAVAGLVSFVIALKEYSSPSRWQRPPAWVREWEASKTAGYQDRG